MYTETDKMVGRAAVRKRAFPHAHPPHRHTHIHKQVLELWMTCGAIE